MSLVCGDGIRDPITEECDDGNAVEDDACRSDCVVNDFLVVPGQQPESAAVKPERYLGQGRHPAAAAGAGFAITFIDAAQPAKVMVRGFGPSGVPVGAPVQASSGTKSVALLGSDPVIAAVSGAKYAVAWTDFGGDGDELGVAVRIVDPLVAATGEPAHANTTTDFSQYDPDILATSAELVVAWADDSSATTGADLRYRTFASDLTPTSAEQTLAATSAFEASVALAPFGGSWAAAWRASAAAGMETIEVKAGATTWSVGPHLPGAASDKPALVELDASTLLVVFTQGAALRGAILSTSMPGATVSISLEPLPPASGSSQSHPNAVRVGQRVFVAWRAGALAADPLAEEVWLREVTWSGSALNLLDPIALPRWPAHQPGDQRSPALAASPLIPGGAIVAAWDDYGQVFGGIEGAPDVVAELIPTPIVRLPLPDGGAGQ